MGRKYTLEKIKEALIDYLRKIIKTKYPEYTKGIEISYPKSREYGDISTNVAFQIAFALTRNKKEAREKIPFIASEIVKELKKAQIPFVKTIKVVNGYVNLFINYREFIKSVLKSILEMGDLYGSREKHNKMIVVEHTSANPIHPIHIGTARNALIGDSIARIYKFIGYDVETRFYVNDMGKQVAYLALVYSKIKDKVKITGKPDHWFGSLYSITNSLIEALLGIEEIKSMKEEKIREILVECDNLSLMDKEISSILRKMRKAQEYSTIDWIDLIMALKSRLEQNFSTISQNNKCLEYLSMFNERIETVLDWLDILKKLTVRWPELYTEALNALLSEKSIEEKISELMRKYESGRNREINELFHEVCSKVLEGIKETLSTVDITFDKFDWESDLVRSGLVKMIIDELMRRGWVLVDEKGAMILNIREALKKEEIREIFELETLDEESVPPNLVLTRSDGTTLYTTRDIAYAIIKGKDPQVEKVFNVIGKDQVLPQKQLKAALKLAGYNNVAEKLIHVAYELVILPGARLSARRGRYVTFDEILWDAEEKALEEIRKRQRGLTREEEQKIAREVAVSAIKYALISVAPDKTITFDWSRIINFEQNSGPFLQYSYARATSILRKIDFKIPKFDEVDYEQLSNEIEKEIVFNLARFPEVVLEASKKLRPDIIAEYSNRIAILFNSFYQRYPVLRAETEEKKKARIIMIEAFRTVLGNAMKLLGIKPLEKM